MFEAGLKPSQTAAWKPSGISLRARNAGKLDSSEKIEHDSLTNDAPLKV